MTKKHFIQLAKEISQQQNVEAKKFAYELIVKVAKETNTRFDEQRFKTACEM